MTNHVLTIQQYRNVDQFVDFLHIVTQYTAPGNYVWLGLEECFDSSCDRDPTESHIRAFIRWKKQNPQCKIIAIAAAPPDSKVLTQLINSGFVTPIYFSTFFVTFAFSNIVQLYPNDFWQKPQSITTMFATLVRGPWLHRCTTMDLLAKEDLIKDTYYTWYYEADEIQGGYPWQYWQVAVNKTVDWDPTGDVGTGIVQEGALPEEYFQSAVDVVIESTVMSYFITEKTVRPVFFGKLFLCVACKGYHKWLSDALGFQLYTELFDYSFDDVDDTNTRIKMLVDQLVRFRKNTQDNNLDLNSAIASVADKIAYNRHRLDYIISNDIGRPSEIADIGCELVDAASNDHKEFCEKNNLLIYKDII